MVLKNVIKKKRKKFSWKNLAFKEAEKSLSFTKEYDIFNSEQLGGDRPLFFKIELNVSVSMEINMFFLYRVNNMPIYCCIKIKITIIIVLFFKKLNV